MDRHRGLRVPTLLEEGVIAGVGGDKGIFDRIAQEDFAKAEKLGYQPK